MFEFWVGHGVKIFRVDNPHTKAFAFWEWAINDLKRKHPELIFLSEAFTRPRVMHKLAKLGFTQSYTYFTWRNSKRELTEYFTELTQHASREYFRPNFWPNTPDILHETLQHGGRPAFIVRAVLAATAAANYGIYGPAYELHGAHAARAGQRGVPALGEVRAQALGPRARGQPRAAHRADQLDPEREPRAAIGLEPASSIRWTTISSSPIPRSDGDNEILVVVNLDVHHPQSGLIDLSRRARCTISCPAGTTCGPRRATTSSSTRTRCRRTCSG